MQPEGIRYRDTIEYRLGLISTTVLIVFFTAVYYYQSFSIKNLIRNFYLEETIGYRDRIARKNPAGYDDLVNIFPRYDNNQGHAKVAGWKLFNNQLEIIQSDNFDNIGEFYNVLKGVEAFRDDETRFLGEIFSHNKYYQVVCPIYDRQGVKIGGLAVTYLSSKLDNRLGRYLMKFRIVESSLVLAFLLALGYIIWRKLILRPLLQFRKNIEKIQMDEQSHQLIPIERNDEIGMLISSFNNLFRKLRINIDELESTKQQTQAFSEELKSAYERLESQIAEMKEAKDQITKLYMVIERVNIDLDKKVVELSILNEVGRAISSILDLDQLLNMIIKWATEEMGARQGAILLLNEEKEMKIQAVYNLDKSLVGNKVDSLDYQEVAAGESRKFIPAITIPLKRKGITSGVINIGAKESGRNFTSDDLNLLSTLANQAAISIENAKLYDTVQRGYFDTIQALALAIEAKDVYTRGHSVRVTKYAIAIAQSYGLPADRIEIIRYAGILHDIGEIGIREGIINKPGVLTDEEYNVMKKHPMIGESIVEPIAFLEPVKSIIRSHHEWYNGNGYPDGLKGEDICLEARILALADAFDSMTSNRPYRRRMSLADSIKELERNSGSQFEPILVTHFVKWLRENMSLLSEEEEEKKNAGITKRPGRRSLGNYSQ